MIGAQDRRQAADTPTGSFAASLSLPALFGILAGIVAFMVPASIYLVDEPRPPKARSSCCGPRAAAFPRVRTYGPLNDPRRAW